ncbi:hypothetical protein PS645_00622 [Pseudomonas fluorescens]|uniref:Uncharacterized protein n=1 Tax=Pseudomonas fluorescens TaxID=294 RepID=A0A5E6PYI1_PSEFL|nr:hypothetical protein PS645_00622 [Pseudomonas fluorescens]
MPQGVRGIKLTISAAARFIFKALRYTFQCESELILWKLIMQMSVLTGGLGIWQAPLSRTI